MCAWFLGCLNRNDCTLGAQPMCDKSHKRRLMRLGTMAFSNQTYPRPYVGAHCAINLLGAL